RYAYYPPVPQARDLSWKGSNCQPRIGWDWCVLGFDPGRLAAKATAHKGLHILVSMGGADPLNFTELARQVLSRMPQDFSADFIIGPAFIDASAIAARIEGMGRDFHALRDVSDLVAEFASADIAVIAFGVTAYEVAALGVPALYLPVSPGHALSASMFVAAGLGLALPEKPSAPQIVAALEDLIGNPARLQAMREAGPRVVDGLGATRIAAELAEAAEKAPA